LVLVSESDLAVSRRADFRANFDTAGFISGYEELAATSVQGTRLASVSSWFRIVGVNERGCIGAVRREREQASMQRFPRKPDDG
jgi:hypothetical protein